MNTVYIVDDDQIVLDDFTLRENHFMSCGFEICRVHTNPRTARREIRKMRPDVVFSDLKMPGLTGIELLESLRRGSTPPPLFVIISAYNEFKDVRKFFTIHRGFDYILKPVSDRDLTELLARLSARLNMLPTVKITTTPSRDLNEILKYLREYPTMNHTLESLGALFSINPNTVCNLFSKHLKTTFIAFLTSLRLERASDLLLNTDLSVKDVGINCGYNSYFYFARVFTKTYGKPPTEYRETMR